VFATLPDASAQCCVTSPPYYGLRDYGVAGQIGLEASVDEYVAEMVAVFREVRRVLRDDGTLWLNLGDSYHNADKWGGGGANTGKHTRAPDGSVASWKAVRRRWAGEPGLKPKDLIGIPWRVAFALQADGWYLRSDIIWSKPNPMPESVRDRPTKAHEYVFLMSKSARYFFDAEAVKESAADPLRAPQKTGTRPTKEQYAVGPMARGENGTNHQFSQAEREWAVDGNGSRNIRSVWTIATAPFTAARHARGDYGGSGRRVSPDCPVHGDRSRLASTSECDVQPAASSSGRSPGTHDHRDPARAAGHVAIPMRLDVGSLPDSSDSLDLACVQPATPHSTQSHRTDRAQLTLPRETGDEESPDHTDGNELARARAATSVRIHESRSAEGDEGDATALSLSEQTVSDNAHTCTCGEYTTNTDHFAVFPPDLAERCIKAGSKEGDTVLDPFGGAGTVGLVADRLGRDAILIELNPAYAEMARRRIVGDAPLFAVVGT
jgi:DNA modification methylase